jgi:hypothetical protein
MAQNLLVIQLSRVDARRVSLPHILGLERWMRLRNAILGPWNFVGVSFTDEAAALAVVALTHG